MKTQDEYPWMQHVCYEPQPLLQPERRSPAWLKPSWVIAAIVIMVFCALLGLR